MMHKRRASLGSAEMMLIISAIIAVMFLALFFGRHQ